MLRLTFYFRTSLVTQSGGYADAREFYDHLLNRLTVKFIPRPAADAEWDTFEIALSRKMTYDQFSAKVGERLIVDSTHIRFSTVNSITNKPRGPVRRNGSQTLYQILNPQFGNYNNNTQRSDSLYYEVMDMSLSELETKKNLKVIWVSEGVSKEVSNPGLRPLLAGVLTISSLFRKSSISSSLRTAP